MRHHWTAFRAIAGSWGAEARKRPFDALLGGALAAALLWLYGSIIVGTVTTAVTNVLWYHCLAVPFAAAWIWYRKYDEIVAAPVKPWWSGGVSLLILAVLFRLGEVGEGGYLFGGVSLIATVAGMVALLGGKERLRRSLFPIGFLFFSIPVPQAVFGFLAFPMQNLSAALTATACRAIGLPVVREGVLMALGDFQVTVATACSGMNSMFALLMCCGWVIGFARVTWYQRFGMLLMIGPIVIAGNVLRLVVMMVVAAFTNGDVALGFFHEGSDLIIFLLLASCLLWVKQQLEQRYIPNPASQMERAGT